MKVFAEISVFGRKEALSFLSSNYAIKHGELKQLGLKKRKTPPPDLWCYGTPLYRLDTDALEEELYSILDANRGLGMFLHNTKEGIDGASMTIIITDQTSEEMFGCFFPLKTIQLLAEIGLELDIDPEVCIPDYPYWSEYCQK